MSFNFDLVELLMVFDEFLSTDDDQRQGNFAFQSVRGDGVQVRLSFNRYEGQVNILVSSKIATMTHLSLANCSTIKVLDQKRRQLEVIWHDHDHWGMRCFLDIQGESILNLQNFAPWEE
jgi:hypothetical protein